MKKNLFSKKTVATLLALALISGVALQPKRSEAALLLAGAFPVIGPVVLGGVVATLVTSTGLSFFSNNEDVAYKATGIAYYTGILGFPLDDSGHQKAVLKPIDEKLAAQAGVTTEEQESYNHELDVIQSAFDDIYAQVAALNESERKAASHKLWNDYRTVISPAAFSAFEKVAAQSAR